MYMNFRNFANELDMYNNIINATGLRGYAPSAVFNLDGYYVTLKATDSDDKLFFILRSTDDSCVIYLQSVNYEGQYISFGSISVEFDDFIKLINNFFYEVE